MKNRNLEHKDEWVTPDYIFEELNDDDAKYFVVSWRDDVPHVFDATDHVLVPLIEG